MLVVKLLAVEMLVHHEPQDGLATRPFERWFKIKGVNRFGPVKSLSEAFPPSRVFP